MQEEDSDEIMGEIRIKLVDILRKTIRPEFLNRIDDIVIFKPLGKRELEAIIEIQIARVQDKLKEMDILLLPDKEVKDWLLQIGYDITYGARPLKRTIQKYIVNPLSQEILMNKYSTGDSVRVKCCDDGRLEFIKM